MLSTFGTTYIYECTFFNTKSIKLKEKNRLTDEMLRHLLCVLTSVIYVDFVALSSAVTLPQNSH